MRWTFSLFIVACIQYTRAEGCKDEKPDFSAQGRRISEQKCHEFNWERKRLEQCSTDPANTEYPYVGGLGYMTQEKLKFLCGAFLVSPKFALTAAHCIKVPASTSLSAPEIIRFGNENLEDNVPHVDAKILRTIVHPEFKPQAKENDVALLELETELPFTKSIHPACLWAKDNLDGVENTFSPGWPRIHKDKISITKLQVKIMEREQCLEHVKGWSRFTLQDSQICANESISGNRGCDTIPTTSPLVSQINLGGNNQGQMPFAVGMASFGKKCGDLGVYSRIYSYIDWIEHTVWK